LFIRFRKSHWRLKVYVVENARRDGRVVQEIVGYLGSVDTRALMSTGDDDREVSVLARTAFWESANPKIKNLANRIGDDAAQRRVRMAVHARIPWPKEPERQRLDLLKADREAKLHHAAYSDVTKMIEITERIVAKATADGKELRRDALREIALANEWAAKAERLRKRK
jgi:uncharacterized protein YdbL (DUF1318 family)